MNDVRSAVRPPARGAAVLAAAGAAAFVAGLFLSPVGVWPSYLLTVFLLTGLGLGAGVFLSLYHLCGGRWGTAVVRVPEAMLSVLPVAGVGTLLLAFGARTLYPWADATTVAADEVLESRSAWMTVPFALARAVVCFAAWTLLAGALARRSRRAVERGDAASRSAAARTGAAFLVVLAPTFSVHCFDWVLSLERHFASTMFAVYHVAGILSSTVALVVVLAVAMRRRGLLRAGPSWEDALHDLGKLLFGFAFFWGYVWFCQFMLVWYVNLPEEAGHYAARHAGGWEPLAAANVALNAVLPMALLLARAPKRREASLLLAAGLVLAGRWLDLFLATAPPLHGAQPGFGPWEVALPAGAAGAFLWAFRRAFAQGGAPTPETLHAHAP
jgi:hypothetical protein